LGRTPRKTHLLFSHTVLGMFTAPLANNRRPIAGRVGSGGNVFTESLPGSGPIRHIIFVPQGKVSLLRSCDLLQLGMSTVTLDSKRHLIQLLMLVIHFFIYIYFTCVRLHNFLSSSGNAVSNGRMIDE
jgi:hypothetical protein